MKRLDVQGLEFHPVIRLPADYEVYDFTQGYDPARSMLSRYGVGKFDEVRVGMYTSELFQGERNIHMGIDLAAPAGEPVYAFAAGEVFLFAYNAAEGDYGYTLITKHVLKDVEVYALHGHLAKRSLDGKVVGQRFPAGEVIAWLGEKHENGGWNPHLHFQLSLQRPEVCDMPGAVSAAQRADALRIYPDPRLVLGPLY